MFSIAKIKYEPNKRKVFQKYEACAEYEKDKFRLDYQIIKEYEHFYLCQKLDFDGNPLYRECFSKFDVDGVKNKKKKHGAIFRF